MKRILLLLSLVAVLLCGFHALAQDDPDSNGADQLVVNMAESPQSQRDYRALDQYIGAQMQTLNLPGLALGIVQGDQIGHLMGYGVADPDGRSMTPQTPIRLASVSKPLTALAVMQLVEAGKLDLDAPVQQYLPWFRLADEQAASSITLRDLIYHISGIPQTAGYDSFYNGDLSDAALERNVRQLAGIAPNRPVGSTYQYANLNYDALGLVVQTVSGQTYESYIEDHIFAPLEMQHSFTSQAEALEDGMATGYRRWFGIPVAVSLPDDRATRPSSFLISSAEDMTHLLIAELNGGRYGGAALLSPQGIAETQRPFVPINESGLYSGMGLDVDQIDGVTRAAKTGGTANYYARIVLLPDSGLGVVVLANSFDIGMGAQFDAIADGIAAWLLDGNLPEIVQSPIGGGSAPIKFFLAAIVLLEIILALRTRIVLPARPAERRWLIRHFMRPLALDVVLVLVMLVALPSLINMPLSFLYFFAPDIYWLLVAVAAIPLVKDVVKALLTAYRLQLLQPTI